MTDVPLDKVDVGIYHLREEKPMVLMRRIELKWMDELKIHPHHK